MADNQSSDSTANANAPRIHCTKGCGFFGTPSTLNMCSACFRDHQKHENPQNGAETAAGTMAAAAAATLAAASAVVQKSASPVQLLSDGAGPPVIPLLPPSAHEARTPQPLLPTTPPPTAADLADAVSAAESARAGLAAATAAASVAASAAAVVAAASPPRVPAPVAVTPASPPDVLCLPASVGGAAKAAAPSSPLALKRKASYPRADVEMAAPSEAGAAASTAAPEDEEPSLPARKVQKDKRRCFSCRKKVGLTALPCRCGYVYCGAHRMATEHGCDFDYKTHGRSVLVGANPLVAATKVNKI